MKKKLVAMLLSLCMGTTLLAGCGNVIDKESNQQDMSSSTSQSSQQSQTGESETANEEKTFDKEMSIIVWDTNNSDYVASEVPAENIVLNWVEEQTNVVVENIIGNGGGTGDSKMIQLLAADALPEVMYAQLSQLSTLGEAGRLYELTEEMLAEYAPDLWERMPEFAWEQEEINGKHYSIPLLIGTSREVDPDLSDLAVAKNANKTNTRSTNAAHPLWIRDDIVKALYPDAMDYEEIKALLEEKQEPIGDLLLDIPIYSTEDYVNLLYEIKELGLKEGEKPVYAFGFKGTDNWQALAVLGPELMGTRQHTYVGTWNFVTEEVEILLDTDLYHDMAKLIYQMVRDGVIEEESLVHTDSQYNEKALDGMYAIVNPQLVPGGITSFNQALKDAGKDYQYRPIYGDFDNLEEYPQYKTPYSALQHICITDSVKEEDLPQILNWLNTFFTEEFESVFYWGPEEAGLYVENADGTRTYTDEKIQARFLESDSSIALSECYGLGNTLCFKYPSYTSAPAVNYHPTTYNNVYRYSATPSSGLQFPVDSEYRQVKFTVSCALYSSLFAEVEEVQDFWSVRQQWEDPFRVVFAAKTDEEFEEKWQDAVDNLHSLGDIEGIEDKMTEIVREELKKYNTDY